MVQEVIAWEGFAADKLMFLTNGEAECFYVRVVGVARAVLHPAPRLSGCSRLLCFIHCAPFFCFFLLPSNCDCCRAKMTSFLSSKRVWLQAFLPWRAGVLVCRPDLIA
jgi:hypothetical protein